jgi:Short C-terminal domain/Bacterial PH domain
LVNSAFEDFPISNISSISYKSGVLVASIEVYASGNKATIAKVNKLDAKEIADAIRARLGRPAPAAQVQTVASAADELAKWAALRDSGVITAEDFEAKKRQLLGL